MALGFSRLCCAPEDPRAEWSLSTAADTSKAPEPFARFAGRSADLAAASSIARLRFAFCFLAAYSFCFCFASSSCGGRVGAVLRGENEQATLCAVLLPRYSEQWKVIGGRCEVVGLSARRDAAVLCEKLRRERRRLHAVALADAAVGAALLADALDFLVLAAQADVLDGSLGAKPPSRCVGSVWEQSADADALRSGTGRPQRKCGHALRDAYGEAPAAQPKVCRKAAIN